MPDFEPFTNRISDMVSSTDPREDRVQNHLSQVSIVSSSSMSVLEFERIENYIPDPDLEDPRLLPLLKDVKDLQKDTNDLETTWRDTHSRIKQVIKNGDGCVETVSTAHDASRKLWTILGTAFLCLAAVNLVRSGTAVWRWYKRIRSYSGEDEEESSRSQTPRRTHPRNWAVRS